MENAIETRNISASKAFFLYNQITDGSHENDFIC